jgi:hypothetical protein
MSWSREARRRNAGFVRRSCRPLRWRNSPAWESLGLRMVPSPSRRLDTPRSLLADPNLLRARRSRVAEFHSPWRAKLGHRRIVLHAGLEWPQVRSSTGGGPQTQHRAHNHLRSSHRSNLSLALRRLVAARAGSAPVRSSPVVCVERGDPVTERSITRRQWGSGVPRCHRARPGCFVSPALEARNPTVMQPSQWQ